MKPRLISIFVVANILVFSTNLFAQRTCGSELNLSAIEHNDPDRYQRIMQMEESVAKYREEASMSIMSSNVVTIPVVVHVLHTGQAVGTGLNISEAQIQSQIDVLNEDFRRLNANASNTPTAFQTVAADVEIEFILACVDPNGNPTNGIVRYQTTRNIFLVEDTNNNGQIDLFEEQNAGIKFVPTGSPAWPADRYLNIWVCNLGGDLVGIRDGRFDLIYKK